eukprot:gene34170-38621_t
MEKKERDTLSVSSVQDRKQRLFDVLLVSLDGRTKDTVKSDNEFMLDGIKGVTLPAYKGAKFGKKDDTRPFALSVCQGLVQMLDFGGFELREIVDCNVDLVAYLVERREDGAALEAELVELESVIDFHIDEPRRKEDFEDKLEIRVDDEKKVWDAAQKALTFARIDRKTRSKSEDNAAAKSGIADEDSGAVKDWEDVKSDLRLECLRDYGNRVEEYKTHVNS